MPTTMFLPTGPVSSLPPYAPATVVGPPPQWYDSSDATYALAYTPSSGGGTTSPMVTVDALPADATAVINAWWHYRLSVTSSRAGVTTNEVGFSFRHPDFEALFGVIRWTLPFPLVGISEGRELLVSAGVDDPSLLDLWLSALKSGDLVMSVDAIGAKFGVPAWTATATVYELFMEVEFESAGGTVRTFVPPLRLFPRSDGRGASSAARVWPRPPTAGYGRVGPGSLV